MQDVYAPCIHVAGRSQTIREGSPAPSGRPGKGRGLSALQPPTANRAPWISVLIMKATSSSWCSQGPPLWRVNLGGGTLSVWTPKSPLRTQRWLIGVNITQSGPGLQCRLLGVITHTVRTRTVNLSELARKGLGSAPSAHNITIRGDLGSNRLCAEGRLRLE